MRERFLPCYKFDRPFTAWLYELSSDGCDEEFGTIDELGYWIGLLGRHVIVEDSNGGVFSTKLADRRPTAADFYDWTRGWLGVETFDAYVSADLNDI